MNRTLRTVGLAAAVVAGLATPAAHASSDVTAVTAAGRALTVGSVVAQGQRNGNLCTFADDTVILGVAGDSAGAITLRADDTCRLVVTSLGAASSSAAAGEAVTLNSRRPKTPDDGTNSAPAGSGGVVPIGVPSVTETDVVGDTVNLALETVAAASSQEQKVATLSQTIYSEGGVRQYEDSTDVQYLRDKRTGAMSNLELTGGYCEGDLTSDYVDTPVTEIRNCFYKPLYNGPARIGFLTGGYYRQVVGGIQTDGRELTETFNANKNQEPTRVCTTGGSLPLGWYNYCFLRVH